MRYRPASRAPGRNRPSLAERLELLLDEPGEESLTATVRVGVASASAGRPQCAQKRPSPARSDPQVAHFPIQTMIAFRCYFGEITSFEKYPSVPGPAHNAI